MRKSITFIFFVSVAFAVNAGEIIQTKRQKYIEEHRIDAIRDMMKTGVPASITLAQACLESQDGGSPLAREANNHFGIKCSNWNGQSYTQDDDKKDECFRKYNTTLESYDDHSLFLTTRPRYSFLFQLDKTDYKSWAKGLKKAGYATDPTYADRLIKIIEDNQLYILDKSQEQPLTASIKDHEPIVSENHSKIVYVPSVSAVNAFAERKIMTLNGVDYVIAKKGDTFKSIAKELKLGYWQLPRYNEVRGESAIQEGQLIFLKAKKKEGEQRVYIVKPGDSMQSIAQNSGMRIKYLCKFNALEETARLEPGQQLFLKKSKS